VAPVNPRRLTLIVGSAFVATLATAAIVVWPTSRGPGGGTRRAQAQVSSPAGGDREDASETPKAAGSGSPSYLIVAAGDVACDPSNDEYNGGRGTRTWCRQRDTAEVVKRIDPDLVVALGDLQYDDGTLRKFRRVYDRSWGDFKRATWPVPGNHEYYVRRAQGFFDYFDSSVSSRGWSSRDIDPVGWHVVGLDSNCELHVNCKPGSPEHDWLEADLTASTAECTLAFMHHPRFSSGPHGNDRSVAPLFEVLYEHGVDLLLVGHDHIYERFAPLKPNGDRDADAGIRQITVGTGGGQHYWIERRQPHSVVRNTDRFGVLKVTLEPGSYSWKFAGISGSKFSDSGSDTCH